MRRAVVVERRAMTSDEIALALAVSPSHVRYFPGTDTKRFAAAMALQAEQPAPLISERQSVALCQIAHRFRRQVSAEALSGLVRILAARIAAVTAPSDTATAAVTR